MFLEKYFDLNQNSVVLNKMRLLASNGKNPYNSQAHLEKIRDDLIEIPRIYGTQLLKASNEEQINRIIDEYKIETNANNYIFLEEISKLGEALKGIEETNTIIKPVTKCLDDNTRYPVALNKIAVKFPRCFSPELTASLDTSFNPSLCK